MGPHNCVKSQCSTLDHPAIRPRRRTRPNPQRNDCQGRCFNTSRLQTCIEPIFVQPRCKKQAWTVGKWKGRCHCWRASTKIELVVHFFPYSKHLITAQNRNSWQPPIEPVPIVPNIQSSLSLLRKGSIESVGSISTEVTQLAPRRGSFMECFGSLNLYLKKNCNGKKPRIHLNPWGGLA